MSNIPDAQDTRKHVVYRCYDADDQLIYIGCTRILVAAFALALMVPAVAVFLGVGDVNE